MSTGYLRFFAALDCRISMYKINSLFTIIGFILLLTITGCNAEETARPELTILSPCPTCPPSTSVPPAVPTDTQEPTSTPEPATLTICLGAEPDTLFYPLSTMLVARNVLEAIYDGPIDLLSYDYQPVILEKLPNLGDGDARLEPVLVKTGDEVINDNGVVVTLKEGDLVKPYGCNRSECSVVYSGGELEMGQLSADFTLIDGLLWSDGEPLTVEDAIFGYEIAQQCDEYWGDWCADSTLVARTAEFIAIDQNSVRWIGKPGFLDPNYMTNFFQPMPEHQLRDVPVNDMDEHHDTSLMPMGWGPYTIQKWEIGKEIRLKANPYYFRAAEGLPHFEQLVFKFTGENSLNNIAKIMAGECDLVDQDAQLGDVTALMLEMDRQKLLQVHFVEGPVWEHFDFSLLHADYDDGYQVSRDRPDFFGDVRTRQAIAMCLDRERVINEVVFDLTTSFEYRSVDPEHPLFDQTFGIGQAPNTYVPTIHPLYNPDVPVYEYSPGEASLLLEEVGWIDHDDDPSTPRIARSVPNVPNGTPFEFDYWTTSAATRKQTALILAESLSRCGIQVNIQHWQAADFFELPDSPVFNRKFDVVEFAWLTGVIPPCELFTSDNIPGDPEVSNPDGSLRFPKGWQGTNNTGYSSVVFDQACQAAQAALPGQPGFIEKHLEAQEAFSRDLPVVPLYMRIKVTAAGADLCGYWMDATAYTDTWNIEEFGYGDDCDQ